MAQDYISEMVEAVKQSRRGQIATSYAGSGLVFGVYRSGGSFLTRLRDRGVPKTLSAPPSIVKLAKQTIRADSDYNVMILGSIQYLAGGETYLYHGTIPVFWWAIPPESAKEIVFQTTRRGRTRSEAE